VPEVLEIERYRRAAEVVVGRQIAGVMADDAWYLKRGLTPAAVRSGLVGTTIAAVRRRGKLLMLDVRRDGNELTLGLRFGMTGRILVDGSGPIAELEYGSTRQEPAWDRFALDFLGGGRLAINDPRRLGGVELDPDEELLGVDALSITAAELRRALSDRTADLKSCLLDQALVAGIGNLLADEMLWRAGLDPARPAASLGPAEHRRLHRWLAAVLAELDARGGSHTGDLQAERRREGRCPKDGAALERRTLGGRTTYSCPRHQR
jgi:formamidopyrimidine-DNA glycosylase